LAQVPPQLGSSPVLIREANAAAFSERFAGEIEAHETKD
jgi:hypothetical protein